MARDSITDPRIQAIMDQLNKKEETSKAPEMKALAVVQAQPPTTYNEFMKAEKLKEWPQRLTSENTLDLSKDKDILGNKQRIEEELKQATPIDLKVLKDLEARLDKFDTVLHKYAYMILVNKEEEVVQDAITVASDGDKLPISVDKAFLTEMAESDAVKAHPARKRKSQAEIVAEVSERVQSSMSTARSRTNLRDSIAESRKKKVEHCVFPGFRKGELTELPTQIEAPHILHRVTKAQDFNRGFRKFWKKIFLSEASVAVMQDTFWWIFLDKFSNEKQEIAKSFLFDRIADSFVALFASVNPEIKDKVFHVYSDCLSQAIYAAYYEAFPESLRIFSEDFKQYICNLIHVWVTGVAPRLNAHKHWNMNRIMPKTMKHMEDPKVKATRDLTMGNESAKNYKLDMDDFTKTIETLGQDVVMPGYSKITVAGGPYGMSREATRLTHLTGNVSKLSMAVSAMNQPPVTPSRVAVCGSPKKAVRESHVIGPGPELERVKFNLKGRSPLIAHYLHMRQLKDGNFRGQAVHRTQVAKLPPTDLPTYRELITETLTVQDALSKEYQKVCEETNQEILKIEKQQRETNRKIERLQSKLMQCKNSMEVKVMSEKILEKQEFDPTKMTLKGDEPDTSINKSFGSYR